MRAVAILATLAACSDPASSIVDAPLGDAPVDAAVPMDSGPCPPSMVLVDGQFCIDQYEAALEELGQDGSFHPASPYLTVGARTVRAVPAAGIMPQGYISGSEAAAACAASSKRLCTTAEWQLACRGNPSHPFPYGDSHVAGACNDAYAGHPVVNYFGTSMGVFDAQHMNDPGINMQAGTVGSGGQFAQCVSQWGAFDLHGNLHEWVDDPAGTFRGGFYADGSLNGAGCAYVTTAHAFTYHDYSTGFRCCSSATLDPGSPASILKRDRQPARSLATSRSRWPRH